ncbi:DUF4145 domain-containing protein [Lysobacter enzymogenes]|uniref:DUF4145 domain-containing protein n=1 Tax=Lysobacter enzymogenes TaxID=69 RepID=UPI003394383A
MADSQENKYQTQCPRCDGKRSCDVLGEHEHNWDWTDGIHSQYGTDHHRLLRCRGCETIFYLLEQTNSEDWDGRYDPETGEEEIYLPVRATTFPTPDQPDTKPDWIWQLREVDVNLSTVMDEVYKACDHGLYVLAATGLRTAFDRATEVLRIDPALTFGEKLQELAKVGAVGEKEASSLEVLVNAGSAAAHRSWRPERGDLGILRAALEQFLYRSFVLKSTAEISARIPPKPKRAKTATP